ncbi:MAG: HAD-IIB family hydrolase [Gammaproteobacteria bacterium]|nr:HAD-IIB family hydrolase [Gammaproteobacteria bacterium]
MTLPKLLLCTDLDRTLIPNGPEPESPTARPLFQRLCREPEVTLVYVSGRDKNLIHQAMDEFSIPEPRYAITDVGTIIYEIIDRKWKICDEWTSLISSSWGDYSGTEIHNLLRSVSQIQQQEARKQNRYKLSYYLPLKESHTDITKTIHDILNSFDIDSNVIWSIDTNKNTGLIDILPARANKLTAIRWLATRLAMREDSIFFAGDSGNDIDVISSTIPSAIVANASSDFKSLALSAAQARHSEDTLYIAKGLLPCMNGNYAAGILEGICYYWPKATEWLTSELRLLEKS